MLEIETLTKKYFQKEVNLSLDTKPENYVKIADSVSHAGSANNCSLCEKNFGKGSEINEDQCHLTVKFREVAHNFWNLNTWKAHTSFEPSVFRNFSGYVFDLYFQNLIKMAAGKRNKNWGS